MSNIKVPNGLKEVEEVFGKFEYTELSGGNISIPKEWELDNIVLLRKVCGTSCNIQLHKKVSSLFEKCLATAIKTCPDYKVRMLGGYVPRHKLHNIKYGLSIHSWGAAFDVNWDTNKIGKPGKTKYDLPIEFIKSFTDSGWEWGGAWASVTDSMHFQFCTGV